MVKLHEIKSLMAIMSTIKSNWKNRNSIKIYQSQIKDLKQHVIQTYWKEGEWHVILQLASLFWQFRMIELATSNEWMWSYWPPYWAKLEINKRCALSLSTVMVSDDDDINIALTRPWKWTTQSALTVQPSCKNQFVFHVFTHKGSSIGSYQGFTILPLRSRS